jgi:hypothetical protein
MAGVSMREPKSSSPNKLRGSGKEFDELLRSICSQHDIDPPKSYEATRKHMLRLGYRFAGAQSVDGKVTKLLRAFAEAGGFSIG